MKRQAPKGFGKFQPGTVRHVSSSVHPEADELYEEGLRVDQAWFAAHPGVQCYARPPHPGEMAVLSAQVGHEVPRNPTVHVCQFGEKRVRMLRDACS
jgi:hypothetical protein